MNKKISLRELIMLGVLIIFAAYYFILHQPVSKEMDELASKQVKVEDELDSTRMMVAQKKKMQTELDAIFAADPDPVKLPEYNNRDNVLTELHAVLGDTLSYNINFTGDKKDGVIWRRQMKITFKVSNYAAAIEKIRVIHESRFGYLISDLSISETSRVYSWFDDEEVGENGYSVNMSVTCFEYDGSRAAN